MVTMSTALSVVPVLINFIMVTKFSALTIIKYDYCNYICSLLYLDFGNNNNNIIIIIIFIIIIGTRGCLVG
jgi:hypothetical protein